MLEINVYIQLHKIRVNTLSSIELIENEDNKPFNFHISILHRHCLPLGLGAMVVRYLTTTFKLFEAAVIYFDEFLTVILSKSSASLFTCQVCTILR